MPLYQLITDKVVSFPYHIHAINVISLPYCTSYKTGKTGHITVTSSSSIIRGEGSVEVSVLISDMSKD